MAELRWDEGSRKALEERLRSPEGREIVSRLGRLIVESALEHMPPELLRTLGTKEGEAAFREAWPDIVDAFLFRRPRPDEASRKAESGLRKTSSLRAKK